MKETWLSLSLIYLCCVKTCLVQLVISNKWSSPQFPLPLSAFFAKSLRPGYNILSFPRLFLLPIYPSLIWHPRPSVRYLLMGAFPITEDLFFVQLLYYFWALIVPEVINHIWILVVFTACMYCRVQTIY